MHKTSVVSEIILTKILKRAKELTQLDIHLNCSQPLLYFLKNKVNLENFDAKTLQTFAYLDDYDIMGALKEWQFNDDFA